MSDNQQVPIIGYFGHHKSASTWFQAICGQVCRELKLNYRIVFLAEQVGGDLARFIRDNRVQFVSYTNADYGQVKSIGNVRGFHVVRDPRDMCVSAYFSHRYSHKVEDWQAMIEHRKRLEECSEEEGLFLEIDWLKRHFDEMRSWPHQVDGIVELKMEEVTTDPYNQMLRVFEHLGLVDTEDYDARKRAVYFLGKVARKVEAWSRRAISLPIAPDKLPAERLLGILWEHDFTRKTKGRALGQEDVKSHYRKGTAGDWKNHFTAAHVAYFKEQCNDLLLRYGYEQSSDWGGQEKGVPLTGSGGL